MMMISPSSKQVSYGLFHFKYMMISLSRLLCSCVVDCRHINTHRLSLDSCTARLGDVANFTRCRRWAFGLVSIICFSASLTNTIATNKSVELLTALT